MAVPSRTLSVTLIFLWASLCLPPAAKPQTPQPAEAKTTNTKAQAAKAAAIKQQSAQNPAAAIAKTYLPPAAAPLAITLSATPSPIYSNQPLRLDATPSLPTTTATYFVEWGDHTEDTASPAPQIPHTYASPGVYRVIVHARATVDGRAEPAESTITLTVTSPPAKTAGNIGTIVLPGKKIIPLRITLTPDPTIPFAEQTVHITATPSYPISYPKYSFDWGDKTPPTLTSEPQAPHIYTSPGPYIVSVQVHALANDNDVSAANRLALTVNSPPPPPPPPQNPTLTLHASQTHALVGHPINFTVASNPPTGFTEFQYHFGDTEGPSQSGPNGVEYAYPRPGTYFATASTLSADGQTTLTSQDVQIRIDPAPLPELVLKVLTPNPLANSATVVSASLDPYETDESYRFDWGDGSPADTVNNIGRDPHTYVKPGTYILSVIAITPAGNIPGQTTIIVVTPPRPPIPIYPILFAVIAAGIISYSAYRHFRAAPIGEVHSTFGVARPATSNISIPADAPYLSLTFTNGAEAPDHHLTFH